MLFTTLDWFIRKHQGIDDETRWRARLMVGLLLFNNVVLISASLGLLVYLSHDPERAFVVGLSQIPMLVLYGGSLIYFFRTLDFARSGNLFLIGQWLQLLIGVILTGGITQSPLLSTTVLVAEYGFLLLGMRGGLRWSAGVFVLLFVLAIAHLLGFRNEPLASPELKLLLQIAAPILLLITSVFAFVLYEKINSELRDFLMIERNHFAHRAAHDPLTGLPNRDEFHASLKLAVWQARQRESRCAVIYIDLDRFKPINDQYGHAAGDQVLRVTGQRLQHAVRDTDIVARLGGDEFAVALFGVTDTHGVTALVGKLQRLIEEPIAHDGQEFSISASFGVAIYPDMADDATALLAAADQQMYAAKHGKKMANSLQSKQSFPGDEDRLMI